MTASKAHHNLLLVGRVAMSYIVLWGLHYIRTIEVMEIKDNQRMVVVKVPYYYNNSVFCS